MKNTMSNREIALFHKYLKADVSKEKIVKSLGVSAETLSKFMPKKIEAVKTRAKLRVEATASVNVAVAKATAATAAISKATVAAVESAATVASAKE